MCAIMGEVGRFWVIGTNGGEMSITGFTDLFLHGHGTHHVPECGES